MNKEDPTQGIPDWLQPFTVNLEDLEYMCSHIPLKEWTQIRKATLQKWRYKNGSTGVHAYFRKTPKEIYSANGREWRLENSVEHKSESRNNDQSAAVVQDLTIQWILPVWKQNFTGDEKNFVEIFRAVTEAKCCWYERLIRVRQFLWRIVMESSDNYTLLLRNERNCRTSCTSSKRRDISRIIAIWIEWKVVVRFYEMLLLSAECPKPPGKREILIWTKIRGII